MDRLFIRPAAKPAWDRHKAKWKDCERCPLGATRKNVCLVRGYLPASVVFLGEAPGESEDALGFPFVGPAGKLLDELIQEAVEAVPACQPFRFAMLNVVGCFPRQPTETHSGEIRKPKAPEIKACQPRLLEVLEIIRPRLLFTVGQIAKSHLPPTLGSFLELPPYHVIHPAAILRMKPEEQNLGYKKALGALLRGLRDCFNT